MNNLIINEKFYSLIYNKEVTNSNMQKDIIRIEELHQIQKEFNNIKCNL